ncbi:MAG: F0F1 ATP synthase subunit delta [Candidatus Paceibacterota bacterium]
MHTSKSIARALLLALRRGEDPVLLATRVKDTFLGTSYESYLPQIVVYLEKMSETERKEHLCRIKSSGELSDKEVALIREIFGATSAELIIEKKLIGGFSAEYEGFLYDASIKNRLTLLKEAIT